MSGLIRRLWDSLNLRLPWLKGAERESTTTGRCEFLSDAEYRL